MRTIRDWQKSFRVNVANAEDVSLDNHRRMKEAMKAEGGIFPPRFVTALLRVVTDIGLLEYGIGKFEFVRKSRQSICPLTGRDDKRPATVGIKFEATPTFEAPMTLTIREIPPQGGFSRGRRDSNVRQCGIWVSLEDETKGKISCGLLQHSEFGYEMPIIGDLEEGVSCE